MPNIVVLGAGVSGLTSALLLAKNKENAVTVIAKHMPGDYDIEYTSPWAGANVLPMSSEADSRWERRTWPELKKLAGEVPEAGIHFQKARILYRRKEAERTSGAMLYDPLFAEKPWFATMFDDYRSLEESDLPPGILRGAEFTSVCINTAIYLPWLVSECLARGVVFRRAVLKHISEAAGMSHAFPSSGNATGPETGSGKAAIVINASGLLASKLGGVMDPAVYPIRGQVVVVRNEVSPMISTSGTEDADDEILYTMTRAAGGGTVVGGTYQKGNWDPNPDPNTALRILSRAVELQPHLAGGKGIGGIDIVRHGVGLRPARTGGVRVEKELLDDGTWVVHNYGHAGWGYQGSYGCAEAVVELVDGIVTEKGRLI